MLLAVVATPIDTNCSILSEADVGSQSTSSNLFTSLAPLFNPPHISDSSPRSNSSDSFPPAGIIPVAASCPTPVIAGNGLMPVAPTIFPFLPIPPYFTSAQGAVAPVMMAVDLRSVCSQQADVSVKDERPASTSEELDTQELTARVRDLLQSHGLGQKLFGEAVLELSQGSVSELLAKPKPWSLLSAKGREPFLRMRAWLADPHAIQRLRSFQSPTLTGRTKWFECRQKLVSVVLLLAKLSFILHASVLFLLWLYVTNCEQLNRFIVFTRT